MPALPTATTAELRKNALAGRPACAVVIPPDGGDITVDVTPRRPDGSVDHGSGREQLVDANLARLRSDFQNLAATKPGLDTLSAIDVASRRHPTPATLVVVSSAISTQSPVDIAYLGWDLDATDLAGRLRTDDDLPDLHGWVVHILGVGDAGGTQDQPAPRLQARLRDLWRQICQAAMATRCDVPTGMVAPEPPQARNTVPEVPFPQPIITLNHYSFPGALFELNSAQLGHDVDDDLRKVITQAGFSQMVSVVGRADGITGSASRNLQLSTQRAEAIRDRLIDLGLPADRITAKGVGSDGASLDAERLDPRRIAMDRRVDITVDAPATPDHS